MTKHKFDAVLERPDMRGARTFIRVPFSVEETFGTRARVAVRGSVNGVEFRKLAHASWCRDAYPGRQ